VKEASNGSPSKLRGDQLSEMTKKRIR